MSIQRVFFMGNGRLGADALAWLSAEGLPATGAKLVGMALHPAHLRVEGAALLAAARLPADHVFDGSQLDTPAVRKAVKALKPDLGVSVMFGHILPEKFLQLFPAGCVNLHPACLPFNRGVHTNVWSILEGTPAGVTLHRIDRGVDTGPILAQRELTVEAVDTGATLYRKQQAAALTLFKECWADVVAGRCAEQPQDPEAGSRHFLRDLKTTDAIDLDAPTTARAVIDHLRARTFAPHAGACFAGPDGRRVQVRVELEYLDEPAD